MSGLFLLEYLIGDLRKLVVYLRLKFLDFVGMNFSIMVLANPGRDRQNDIPVDTALLPPEDLQNH
ncbi:MAG: hypothetical protein OK438_00465 [Thaumarchaeota archaeon]|nr:hypothetical protein [Nitrososphaerota archaeon]